MKVELRIPTQEQYAYIGLEYEAEQLLTDDAIDGVIDDYRRATARLRGQGGIHVTEFETFIQKQLEGDGNTIETYNQMSPEQQSIVQMIKRLKKRVAYKINKTNE